MIRETIPNKFLVNPKKMMDYFKLKKESSYLMTLYNNYKLKYPKYTIESMYDVRMGIDNDGCLDGLWARDVGISMKNICSVLIRYYYYYMFKIHVKIVCS